MRLPRARIHRRRVFTLLAALAALVLIAVAIVLGTSGGGSSPAVGNARDAVATVQAFQKAISDRDYQTICDRLFTTDAREASGGGNCAAVLAQNAARIQKPQVQIRSVVLRGNLASVSVVAQVKGGPPVADTIRLIRQKKDGYRISSAGSAAGGGES
jgi:type II secretory pathway pseudopilin PulG